MGDAESHEALHIFDVEPNLRTRHAPTPGASSDILHLVALAGILEARQCVSEDPTNTGLAWREACNGKSEWSKEFLVAGP